MLNLTISSRYICLVFFSSHHVRGTACGSVTFMSQVNTYVSCLVAHQENTCYWGQPGDPKHYTVCHDEVFCKYTYTAPATVKPGCVAVTQISQVNNFVSCLIGEERKHVPEWTCWRRNEAFNKSQIGLL